MPDPIKRAETTHIDEIGRTAKSTVQWFAEQRNVKENFTHPITHNNRLTVFICGQEGFADIADQIRKAEHSIDLCCWGFDPGMELVRGDSGIWPRGETYGDMLIAAAKRGVTVRLMVWFDRIGSTGTKNLPGYQQFVSYINSGRGGSANAARLSAQNSVAWAQEELKRSLPTSATHATKVREKEQLRMLARKEYCATWYRTAVDGLLEGITIRTRNGSPDDIKESLKTEKYLPGKLSSGEIESAGMKYLGTHHQKTILIDFAHQEGRKAVGYVMGLNSVTDYWDTAAHLLDDLRREYGAGVSAGETLQGKEDDPGFRTMRPLQDYACRLDGGKALIDVYNNFVSAWDRAVDDRARAAAKVCVSREFPCGSPPALLLRKAESGDSSVQIVRTQPEERDKSIKDVCFQATDVAATVGGYLYAENQYFQWEEWAKRLMDKREKTMSQWSKACSKAGKSMEDMPVLHVFVVIPVPERPQMVPRTYDTLATLGQHAGMTGQDALIKRSNELVERKQVSDEFGAATDVSMQVPVVVQQANDIDKPDAMTLESKFGLKVSVAMLNVSAFHNDRWRYREVYIHSKLLLVGDAFFTLGSANMNQRSMAVDSEINLATNNANLARDLRRRVWTLHSGGLVNGGDGTKTELAKAFKDWTLLMKGNRNKKLAYAGSAIEKKITGFLLPLEDSRSSTMRLG